MTKFCVFCGLPPERKNKEHIIPQWLMKLTDTDKKEMSVGSNWKTGEEIVFNFSSFTFPSCTKCNTEYAELESSVKPIIQKILIDEYVLNEELILLLDWFDKVRISLWLAIKYHNNESIKLEPKYYIKNRMRLKDRLLAITNCYDNYKGIAWTGVNTYFFITSPTCFTMRINNVLFTNCSMDFILSEKLGFPYPAWEKKNLVDEALTDMLLLDGKKVIQHVAFKSKLYRSHIMISQPIFKVTKEKFPDKYNNDFVKEHSLDFNSGEGKLFVSHENITYVMESEEEISFQSKSKTRKTYKFNRPTLELQYEIMSSRKMLFNSDDEKRKHNLALDIMKKNAELQLKKFDY